MSDPLQPQTVDELRDMVRFHNALLPSGGGTKPALSTPPDDVHEINMGALSGIIEYEPTEYTFTACAGTPLAEIATTLAEHGQYMPFDPLLVGAGATLGGTIAANTSGSGRYRYGGVRDFILGVQFVDGQGRLVRGGGKVVKNAAGFDLPKFFVGSAGRYGILAEASFKVFPQPPAYVTLTFSSPDVESALEAVFKLTTSPLEMDALDIEPDNDDWALLVRIGGLREALPGRVTRLQSFLGQEAVVTDDDAAFWREINNLTWAADYGCVAKVPLVPKQISMFDAAVAADARRYTAGGNVAWVATDDPDRLHNALAEMSLVGMQLRGTVPYMGVRHGVALAQRVKEALDPDRKFPEV